MSRYALGCDDRRKNMKMNVIKRMIIVFLCMMLFISFGYNAVNASDGWGEDIIGQVKETEDPDITKDGTGAAEKVQKVMGTLAVVYKIVAVAVAIVILIALAIKYMMAAPGDKADVKKSMIPFVVGAFILFASSGIIDLIIKFSSQLSS